MTSEDGCLNVWKEPKPFSNWASVSFKSEWIKCESIHAGSLIHVWLWGLEEKKKMNVLTTAYISTSPVWENPLTASTHLARVVPTDARLCGNGRLLLLTPLFHHSYPLVRCPRRAALSPHPPLQPRWWNPGGRRIAPRPVRVKGPFNLVISLTGEPTHYPEPAWKDSFIERGPIWERRRPFTFDVAAERGDLTVKLIESSLFCLVDLHVARVLTLILLTGSSMSKWKGFVRYQSSRLCSHFCFLIDGWSLQKEKLYPWRLRGRWSENSLRHQTESRVWEFKTSAGACLLDLATLSNKSHKRLRMAHFSLNNPCVHTVQFFFPSADENSFFSKKMGFCSVLNWHRWHQIVLLGTV